MKYEIDGRIKIIKDTQTVGAKGTFTKREFVVTVPDQKYPQDIALECHGDKCAILDAVSEGQEVTAHFDIKGREYNGRYFNNLVCWKIDTDAQEETTPVNQRADRQPIEGVAELPAIDDDLHF